MASNTLYGLAVYFYSRDVGRIIRTAKALEYGIVVYVYCKNTAKGNTS